MDFNYDGMCYEVLVTKKNNKHLYIRVNDELKINVTCPYLYTNKMICSVIKQNKEAIIKMIEKQKCIIASKLDNDNCLLGKPIAVVYGDVKRPKIKGNILTVKDDLMLDRWYKKCALDTFKSYVDEAYEVFEEKIPYPKIKVRNMKTRWGVCNRKDNSVTLNLELIKKIRSI